MAGTEKVGIEIELTNAEEAYKTLRNIDETVKSIGRKKTMIKLDDGSLVSIDERIKEIQDKLAAVRSSKNGEIIDHGEVKTAKDLNNELRVLQRGLKDATANSKTFAQSFNSISSKVAHVGSAMQSLGNSLTRLTSPFNRLTTGLLYGAGYKALNLFTEGLSGTFERADTMKLYPKMLQEFGFSAEKSQKAIAELEESVLGLPTGLDEIVAVQKRFVAASQDMEKSTGLAIAYNNAILASGSDARQQWTAQRILTQLAGGAEIAATSWDALQRAIPLVFTELSKDAKMGVGDYVSALKTGQISTEEFMKDFTKIGGKGGSIQAAAMTMTKSWQGLTANIQNATKRMGTAILDSLHEVFKDGTGRDLLDTLLGIDAEGNRTYDGIRDWIDGISESIQNWIKSNPDKILEFFDQLKSIDWKGLMKGFAEGMMWFAKAMGAFAKWASNRDMEKIGKWFPRLNLLGKGLTILGGALKGTRHIWGFLGAVFPRLGKWFTGKLGKVGLFGRLMAFFGKGKDIEKAGEVGKAMTKASPLLIKGFKNMALLGAIIGGTTFTGWAVTKGVKSGIKNFKETIDILKEIRWEDAKKVLIGIAGYLGGSAVIGGLVGKFGVSTGLYTMAGEVIIGLVTSIATAFAAGNMRLIKDSFKSFADSMKYLQDGMDVLKTLPSLTGIGGIVDSVGNAIDGFNQVTETLQGKRIEKGETVGGLKDIGEKNVKSLKNIADSVQYIKDAVNGLNELATIGINTGISSKLEYLAGVFEEVTGFINGEGYGANKQQGVPRVNDNKVSSLKNISDAVGHLKTIVDNLNTLAGTGLNVSGNVVSKIQEISRVVDEVIKAFPTWTQGGIKGPGNLNKNANTFADALIGIKRMAYHINSLAGTSVDTDGFSAFVEQLKEALTELQALSGMLQLDIEVKLSPKFKTSVNNVVKQINKARKDINDALDKMPTSLTKTIGVNIQARVNTAGAIAAINSGASAVRNAASNAVVDYNEAHQATGGMVYRARGGGIPNFKRRGTDTVPAMLTPGEYVHNRRAVSTFGIDFMRKVNNLDVKGAMNELMHRAGGMANINRGVSITNNNYNNQKVTINNSNNAGAGFTFKSASRFVGAF